MKIQPTRTENLHRDLFVIRPRIGWFFPVRHRRNVIHNNIWGNSVMEWMMSPELAALLLCEIRARARALTGLDWWWTIGTISTDD